MGDAQILSAALISIRAEGWDGNNRVCEVVQVYKYVQTMEIVKQSGPWSSLGSHGCYVFFSSDKCISTGGETVHNEILTI